MVNGIIGRKLGMTQLFDTDGSVIPATVIKAGPCVVVQRKSAQTDGYESVQLGLVDDTPARANKPTTGHFKHANAPPTRVRREVKIAPGAEAPKTGEQVLVDIFAKGDRVDVIATSRGKGFQGVMKRHNFRGGAATHGSRASICGYPILKFLRIGGTKCDEDITLDLANARVVRLRQPRSALHDGGKDAG